MNTITDHSWSDRDIIKGYLDTVCLFHTIRQQIAWNIHHGLKTLMLDIEKTQLMADIMRFEDIIERIPDRRTRNIIRCRFALGMDVYSIAEYMGMSGGHVERIVIKTMKETEHRQTIPAKRS